MRQVEPYALIRPCYAWCMYFMVWSDTGPLYEVYTIYGTPNMRKEWRQYFRTYLYEKNEEILGAFMKQEHFISFYQIFLDISS
jgi:hypothetical protein